MKIRPYITFDGQCKEAVELYKKAFKTDTLELMLFSDMPPMPGRELPEEYKGRVLQATLKFGDDFIRMSDCADHGLNERETERLSLAFEASEDAVRHAFDTLKKDGRVGMELEETFYSPCFGVVFDKFGVMWNLAATPIG